MNKEKILNKIGSLIDKAELTEEDLAKFFKEDEEPKTPETAPVEPKAEDTQDEVKADGVESKEEEGEAEPVKEDEKPEEPETEEPKPSSEAVPEVEPKEEHSAEIEALSAKIDSLMKVLEQAGVLEHVAVKNKQVGVGTASAPNYDREGGNLDDTLAKLNRGRR